MTADIHQPLFIESEHEKVAMLKMSQDVNEWDENVIEHLHEEYPEITDSNVEVVFKKTDPHKGYGYGFVGLGKNAEVKIPIIIKEYEMAPLDVMLHDDTAYPMTRDSVKGMLQKTAMGTLVSKPRSSIAYIGPNVSERIYPGIPWSGGHYKFASILSAVDLTQDQVDGFSKKFEDDPSLLDAWSGSACKDILKIASAKQDNSADLVKPGAGHPLVDAFIKRFDGSGEYGVIDAPGKYEVTGVSGVTYSGVVFPKVFDFNLQPQGVMVFAHGNIVDNDSEGCAPSSCSYSAIQASIAGRKTGGLGRLYGRPSRGEHGVFVISRGISAMAFTPVKLLSVSEIHEKRKVTYHRDDIDQDVEIENTFVNRKCVAVDSFGSRYKIVISPSMKEVKIVDGIVMMPSDTFWMSMDKIVNLRSSPEQMKTASGYSVTMRHLGGEGFSIESPWAEEWVKEGGLKDQVEDYLSQYYNRGSLKEVFEECVKTGSVNFSDRAPKEAIAVNKYEGMKDIARDLTKEAAALGDAGLVDNVLSLQFINKDNVSKYIEFIPQLEKAASNLADMLIGARLGVNVEEHPIKTAMENVVEVIDDLRLLKG